MGKSIGINQSEDMLHNIKRIFNDTRQAILDCNFLTKQELHKLMLTQDEHNAIINVTEDKISLIRAATLLRELHARFLRIFVLSAFDLTWDMLTIPKRFQYAKQKELTLYEEMMSAANSKQEEIKIAIQETLNMLRSNHEDDDTSSSYSSQSTETIYSKDELQLYRQEIQEFVLQQLNASIANKLVNTVDSLRKTYVGTLERCLASLEQTWVDNNEPPNASLALRQILNAAYRIEISVESSVSVVKVIWAKLKQMITSSLPIWDVYYNNYGCIVDSNWRKQQALDIINNISESRLAKSICMQFRQRLRQSHEQFLLSIKELESQHSARLQHTEELRLRVRKVHAPRMAKFALESTSLIDVILYGMPTYEKEIGRGQYGVVYSCESWGGYSPCAIKSVVPPDDRHWNDLAMEFYYTRCIPDHERIVSIYGSVIDHSYGSGSTPAVLLIMERLNRDLYSAIKAGLDWLSRLQVAIDVVEGIRFLHNQGLVHRDIKLKNILLDSNNRAKLTDLGFCKPEAMMSGSVVGTPIHMSPELFSGRYDNSVDVYAFGILFWYICAGHVRLPHIFEHCLTRDRLWNCVRKGVRPERLPQFDNECWELMTQCWDGDKTKRPHLGDVDIRLKRIQARYMF